MGSFNRLTIFYQGYWSLTTGVFSVVAEKKGFSFVVSCIEDCSCNDTGEKFNLQIFGMLGNFGI